MILGTNLSRLIFGGTETVKTASKEFDAVKISEGLEKVASLPYSPSTYESLKGMLKIASQCINSLNEEVQSKDNSISEFEKKAEVRIIIDDMIESGLTDEMGVGEKVSSLLLKTDEELNAVKEAVKLSADMQFGKLFGDGEDIVDHTLEKKAMFEGIIN